jgi:hypothetical protein
MRCNSRLTGKSQRTGFYEAMLWCYTTPQVILSPTLRHCFIRSIGLLLFDSSLITSRYARITYSPALTRQVAASVDIDLTHSHTYNYPPAHLPTYSLIVPPSPKKPSLVSLMSIFIYCFRSGQLQNGYRDANWVCLNTLLARCWAYSGWFGSINMSSNQLIAH